MFLRRSEWNGGIQPSNADDGAVELVESFFVDDGGDLSGETSGTGVLVKDDDFVRLLHGLHDGFTVQRRNRTQVENFQIDSFLAENVSRFQCRVDHRGV